LAKEHQNTSFLVFSYFR